MVSALYILAAALGAAFLLGLLSEERRGLAYGLTLAALAFMAWVSATWVWAFATSTMAPVEILTAGTPPPFAINLRVGLAEATMTLLVNLVGLASALYLRETLLRLGRRAMAVLLIAIMALAGLILTRDLFNLFVFMELMAISTAGLILLSDDSRALGAGFKYLVVSQVVSVLLLIGIIFAYHVTGTLNIDGMAQTAAPLAAGIGSIAVFLILIALIAELKPFPANGWALDIYKSAHPAYGAIFSAASGATVIFAVDKVLSIGGPAWLPVATGVGIATFLFSNLLALPQTNDRRLLGYSSVGQIGLVLAVVGLRDVLGDAYGFIAFGLLVSNAVAKAGLFWLSGTIEQRGLTAWAVLRQGPWPSSPSSPSSVCWWDCPPSPASMPSGNWRDCWRGRAVWPCWRRSCSGP